MKVVLIILALGGYNADSPALLKIEVGSKAECTAVGDKLLQDWAEILGSFGGPKEYKAGYRYMRYSCVEVSR